MAKTSMLSWFVIYIFFLAIRWCATSKEISTIFKTSVYHGHMFVTWIVVEEFLQSNVPVKYTINYCPPQLNLGVNACGSVTPVCSASYTRRKSTSTPLAVIKGYPDNIEKYLTKRDYEDINDTIETNGPLVKGMWDPQKNQFQCGIFLHRCMDGQLNPSFVYEISKNGSKSTRYYDHIYLNDGPAAKPENISVRLQKHVGCCSFNMTATWEIIHVCRVDVPTFDIWVTTNNKTVFKETMANIGAKIYSFEIVFGFLQPSTQHTMHIESYKTNLENLENKIYVNKSFRTPPMNNRDDLNTTATGDNGFLFLNWHVENRLLNSAVPVLYNISWCPQHLNHYPFACRNSTTVCSAVYNGSQTYINTYKENVLKYADSFNISNSTSRERLAWVNGTWDEAEKRFSCGIFLNACHEKINRDKTMKIETEVNGAYLRPVYRTISVKDGFSTVPKHLTVSTMSTHVNLVEMTVKWQLRKMCSPNAATSLFIWITRKDEQHKPMHKKLFTKLDATIIKSELMYYNWSFHSLRPHTLYTVHIETKHHGVTIKHTKQDFLAVDGVPAKPTIASINPSACDGNRRNISIQWKMPPKNTWNGVIRNVGLVYWAGNHPEEKKEVILGNVTLWTLFDLKCDVGYHVKVRVCLRQNKNCSEYSPVQVIGKSTGRWATSSKSKVGFILLWTIVTVVLVFLVVVFSFCLYTRYRKRRIPLEKVHENSIGGYTRPFELDLSRVGTYNKLDCNDEV